MTSVLEDNTPKPYPIFPIEILETIIDDVANGAEADRRQTLKDCCLLSKDFVAVCQRHLFKKVELYPATDIKRRERLLEVLEQKPQLGHYVKEASYILPIDPNTSPGLPAVHRDRNSFALNEFFPNAETLTITHTSCRMPILCECCMVALHLMDNFASSQSIKRVVIEGVRRNLYLGIFLLYPKIESLSLTSCWCEPWVPNERSLAGLQTWSRNLKTLSLRDVKGFSWPLLACLAALEDFTCGGITERHFALGDNFHISEFDTPSRVSYWDNLRTVEVTSGVSLSLMAVNAALQPEGKVAFPSIRKLTVNPRPRADTLNNFELVLTFMESLEEITVAIPFFEPDLAEDLNLKTFLEVHKKTLKTASFVMIFEETLHFEAYGDKVIELLCDALLKIRAESNVETLSIQFFLMKEPTAGWAPNLNPWKRLMLALLENRAVNFRRLRKVEILLNVKRPAKPVRWTRFEYWRDALQLQRLSSQAKTYVSFFIEVD
ncbi:hypothetical protein CVT24_009018 [Panaeolus cyanescens]|uniref:F-box domain-containing protein n=1 Tax=Panaeolus cyanescens TaxID=181874 RepID=A0A409YAN3_9AGAR|nr:hypothetical protein CVT24_009018 [Panaeolus cyanescens]